MVRAWSVKYEEDAPLRTPVSLLTDPETKTIAGWGPSPAGRARTPWSLFGPKRKLTGSSVQRLRLAGVGVGVGVGVGAVLAHAAVRIRLRTTTDQIRQFKGRLLHMLAARIAWEKQRAW